MTDVLNRDQGPQPTGTAPAGAAVVLDDATKQLLRQIVETGGRSSRPRPGEAVDWEGIWSQASDAPTEEMALGSALLAAAEAVTEGPGTSVGPFGRSRGSTGGRAAARPASAAPVTLRPERRRPLAPRVCPAEAELPRRLRRAVTGATWVRNVGVIVVLFAVWQLWGTGLAESQAQSHLRAQYQALVRQAARTAQAAPRPSTEAGGVARAVGARGVTAAAEAPVRSQTTTFIEAALPGGVLGRIRIPAIGVDDYFVEGVGEPQLQEGPGRYPGSGLPGQVGNLAIAGHRTTYGAPFFRLGEVKVGDDVLIDVPSGRATYMVAEQPFAVSPDDVNVLADYGDARLTLTTCNPPFFATTRLIVVAKLAQWLPTGAQVLVPIAAPRPSPAARVSAKLGSRPIPVADRVAVVWTDARRAVAAATAEGRTAVRYRAVDRVSARAAAAVASGAAAVDTFSTAFAIGMVASATVAPADSDASTIAPAVAGAAGIGRQTVSHDQAAVSQGLASEGGGWHLARLPVVLAIVALLCALGTLYKRVARLCVGASRWLVLAPMWAAGLLVLFKVLGLLLPADL